MTLTEDRQLGRARNAVLALLEQKLVVPKIYLDAEWCGRRVGVLAIDRDGVGDVHVVLFLARPYFEEGNLNEMGEARLILDLIHEFATVAAHYKYIAIVETSADRKNNPFRAPFFEEAFSPDGIGRIGFIAIDVPLHGEPQARIDVKPERFRTAVTKIADAYVQEHTADWEIRA